MGITCPFMLNHMDDIEMGRCPGRDELSDHTKGEANCRDPTGYCICMSIGLFRRQNDFYTSKTMKKSLYVNIDRYDGNGKCEQFTAYVCQMPYCDPNDPEWDTKTKTDAKDTRGWAGGKGLQPPIRNNEGLNDLDPMKPVAYAGYWTQISEAALGSADCKNVETKRRALKEPKRRALREPNKRDLREPNKRDLSSNDFCCMEEKKLVDGSQRHVYKTKDEACNGGERVIRNCTDAFRAEYSTVCSTNGAMAGTEICNQFEYCDKYSPPGYVDKNIYKQYTARFSHGDCPATCCMEEKYTLDGSSREEYKNKDGACDNTHNGGEGVFRNCTDAFRAEYSTICGTNGAMAGTEICNQFQWCHTSSEYTDKHIYSQRTEMNGCPATCCMERKTLVHGTPGEEYRNQGFEKVDGSCRGGDRVFRNCTDAFRAEYSTICGTNGAMAGTEICNQFQWCHTSSEYTDKHIYSQRTEMNNCPATCCMEQKRTVDGSSRE